ncbi:MAG: hypothetical protein KME19_17310 [Microcoleus vaginatus WJT46-NPBG5]|nr:hypothetical protein [Microcoleus vaginatus WJT46-NPBG5]
MSLKLVLEFFINKPKESVEIILEFVELQHNLIFAFQQTFPHLNDWEYMLDFPQSGNFYALGEEWKFQRHGKGICFTGQKSGKVVDAHAGILTYPKAFDAWRLEQYFDSIGVETTVYKLNVFNIVDEDGTEKLLDTLLKDSLITLALERPKLYLLNS